MDTLKLILKGILLWITALVVISTIASIDIILNTNIHCLYIIAALNIALILLCIVFITEEEFNKLSGYNWFNKLFNI